MFFDFQTNPHCPDFTSRFESITAIKKKKQKKQKLANTVFMTSVDNETLMWIFFNILKEIFNHAKGSVVKRN